MPRGKDGMVCARWEEEGEAVHCVSRDLTTQLPLYYLPTDSQMERQ